MGKVTAKLQVTVPKAVAERYGLRPGDEIEWLPAGDSIRVLVGRARSQPDVAARLRLFDAASARQRRRQHGRRPSPRGAARGWTREDLYARARPG